MGTDASTGSDPAAIGTSTCAAQRQCTLRHGLSRVAPRGNKIRETALLRPGSRRPEEKSTTFLTGAAVAIDGCFACLLNGGVEETWTVE
jgi:hypothetical protein